MKSLKPNVEILPSGWYTARELRLTLAKVRQKNVPVRTFSYWKKNLNISPTECGLYDEGDRQLLAKLVRWLNRGGSIKQFIVKNFGE